MPDTTSLRPSRPRMPFAPPAARNAVTSEGPCAARPLIATLNPDLDPALAPEEIVDLTLAPLLAPASQVDLARSRQLRRSVIRKHRDRECFENAGRSNFHAPDSVYVEGYAVSHTLYTVIEHGWRELPNGVILDPARAFCGADAGVWTYFPAFRWAPAELGQLCLASPGGHLRLPIQALLPSGGPRYPQWRNAILAAHRHRAALQLEAFGHLPYPIDAEEKDLLRALLGSYWVNRK